MYELIKRKISGLSDSLVSFNQNMIKANLLGESVIQTSKMIASEMEELDFDKISVDAAGNIIGEINGYESKENIVLISRLDMGNEGRAKSSVKNGVVASIYAGAALKRALIPLSGNLTICCVPRTESCNFGVEYLFNHYLKKRISKIKGVVLCEPTSFDIYLGHKGRMEYEIVVRDIVGNNFLAERNDNMSGSMYPLVHELEKFSQRLPHNYMLGNSSLRVKDTKWAGTSLNAMSKEFRVVVDRSFVPEEEISAILKKAKTIAQAVYKNGPAVEINAAVATEKVRTTRGFSITSRKEFKPWVIESNHPFVLSSLEVLKERGINSKIGHWKNLVTEGSYTYGELQIPTIGFGAGTEDATKSKEQFSRLNDLQREIYGHALLVVRSIGMPTFGWSTDEI